MSMSTFLKTISYRLLTMPYREPFCSVTRSTNPPMPVKLIARACLSKGFHATLPCLTYYLIFDHSVARHLLFGAQMSLGHLVSLQTLADSDFTLMCYKAGSTRGKWLFHHSCICQAGHDAAFTQRWRSYVISWGIHKQIYTDPDL